MAFFISITHNSSSLDYICITQKLFFQVSRSTAYISRLSGNLVHTVLYLCCSYSGQCLKKTITCYSVYYMQCLMCCKDIAVVTLDSICIGRPLRYYSSSMQFVNYSSKPNFVITKLDISLETFEVCVISNSKKALALSILQDSKQGS